MPSARSRSVVGQMQHVERLDCSRSMSHPARCVACTAVNRSPRTPCRCEQLDRRATVHGAALLVLGRLLADVRMQRRTTGGGPLTDHGHGLWIDAAYGVNGGTDPGVGRVRQAVDSIHPPICIAVVEPLLRVVEDRFIGHPCAQVARVQQCDSDAGSRGGFDQHAAHLVRLRVRHAATIVVQVVELADACEPGQHHLGECCRRQFAVAVGVEPVCERVHPISPRPERTGLTMRTTAQCAVKGVTVSIRHPRQRQPGETSGARRSFPTHIDTDDPVALDRDGDAALDAAGEIAEPRQLAPVRRHDPTRATNSVIRSTNAVR